MRQHSRTFKPNSHSRNEQLPTNRRRAIYTQFGRCDYCGIPNHKRSICKIRITDVLNCINRAVHPDRGQIPSGNQIRREKAKMKTTNRKRVHNKQEDPHIPKTRPPHTHGNNRPAHITMDDNQTPTTSTVQTEYIPINIMDLPTETIRHIMKYQPFQEIMKL